MIDRRTILASTLAALTSPLWTSAARAQVAMTRVDTRVKIAIARALADS